jgi:PAS domain S-box-containing protein
MTDLNTPKSFNKGNTGKQQIKLDSEDRYRNLVENLTLGIYRNTPGPNGRFLEANSAMVSLFEAGSKSEFMKHSVSDLYQNPKERKEFVKEIMEKGEVKNKELNLVTLKGKKIVATVSAVMDKDENGNVYFDGIIENVTRRKQMENDLLTHSDTLESQVKERTFELQKLNKKLYSEITERKVAQNLLQAKNKELEDTKKAILNVMSDLREISARNEAILASMADGVIVINRSGIIILMNQSAERLLGYTVHESIGKKWDQILNRVDEDGNSLAPTTANPKSGSPSSS